MANRSSFSSILPRNLGRFIAMSQDPAATLSKEQRLLMKRGPVEVIHTKTGEKVTRMVVHPDYQRQLRLLFADAHKHHRGFKTQRLNREVIAELKTEIANTAAEVA